MKTIAAVLSTCALTAMAVPAGPKKHSAPGESRSYHCAAGYELQGKQCIMKEVHPESLICPSGTQELDGRCTMFTGLLKQCPSGYTASGKSCVRPNNQPASPFCNNGFTLTGKECEKWVDVPAYCPAGYSQDNNGCSQYAGKLSECPNGFSRSGKGCTKITSFPRAPVCDNEYALENNQCVKHVPIPAFCPSGFTQDNNGCAQYTSKLSECPVGFTMSGKGCKKTISFPKAPVCDNEYTLENNQCVKHVPIPAFCPSGFTQDNNGCAQYTGKLSECPVGFTMSGKGCKKTISFPKAPVCDNEYTLENNQCVKHVPVAPFCPSGYTQDKNGCSQYTNKLSECPAGFTKSHKGCKKQINIPRIPQCDKGYNLENNTCTKVVQATPYSVCSRGVKQGDQCVSVSTATKQYVCQKGETLRGNACVTQNQFDCSTTVYETVCESTAPVHQGKGGWLRNLGGKKTSKKYTPTYSKNAPVCTKVPRTINKMCTKEDQTPAQAICPAGFQMNGKECSMSTYEPAQLVQPPPQVLNKQPTMVCPAGGCVHHEEAPMNHYCPSGYTDAGDRCLKATQMVHPAPRRVAIAPRMICTGGQEPSCTDTEKAELNYYCPNGYTNAGDRCLKTTQMVQPAPRRVAIAPRMICTGGQEPSCTDTEKAELNYYCPNGYTDAGDRCLKTAQLVQPAPRRVAIAPRMICTGGQDPSCTISEKAQLNYYCPNGYTNTGDKCLKTAQLIQPAPRSVKAHPQYQCPAGFTLNNKQCLSTDTIPHIQYCAAGYEQIGDRCAKYAEHISVCRIGQKSGKGCVVTKSSPAEVTIVRTCTKGTKGC